MRGIRGRGGKAGYGGELSKARVKWHGAVQIAFEHGGGGDTEERIGHVGDAELVVKWGGERKILQSEDRHQRKKARKNDPKR